ncbi:MAG: DEAD/DEAH box helicase, partial [Myxococcota bacterium]
SLSFALRHALTHGMERVIYAIPFTSIVEQNADVFRSLFEPLNSDVVLEHHSNFDVSQETVRSRLATQNWDAPLVVTTNVQFFESLFGYRTQQCRKLHAVARSVVVLDEAQAMPPGLLAPTLRALRELVEHYGVSVVLCTATQPAIIHRNDFPQGLTGVREIIADPELLFQRLRRVEVTQLGSLNDSAVAERLTGHPQALCIVNTRRQAKAISESLGEDSTTIHLSAAMCPEHRTQTLDEARRRLGEGEEIRLISTQLIEAGVDIDFPVVYRATAGLDSIAQAAGRCNRNGKLDGLGRTFVFDSEHKRAERFIGAQIDHAREILDAHPDVLHLDAIEHYFRLHYWSHPSLDENDVLGCFTLAERPTTPLVFNFRQAAQRFRWIDSAGVTVVVPWGRQGEELCNRLRESEEVPPRWLLRKLQRFSVQIRERAFEEHRNSFDVVHTHYPILVNTTLHYSDRYGLDLDSKEPIGLFA